MLWQRRQLLDQSSSPLSSMLASLEAAPLDSAVVFRLAFGQANTSQLTLMKMSRIKAARWQWLTVAIISFLGSETYSGLKKKAVSFALAPRIVPLIRGLQYRPGSRPI